jgi:hypothetical protein
MALSPINPTQLTPPRVAFIDERSGAISREWYRFFLSLLTATQTNQEEVELAPDATSLIASYDAMLATLAQATETQPEGASNDDVAVLQTQIDALALAPPPKQHLTYPAMDRSTIRQRRQPLLSINTAFAMTFNTVDLSFGVTRRHYPNLTNLMWIGPVFTISSSLHSYTRHSGGVALACAYIWLKKNGTNVPDSTGQYSCPRQ